MNDCYVIGGLRPEGQLSSTNSTFGMAHAQPWLSFMTGFSGPVSEFGFDHPAVFGYLPLAIRAMRRCYSASAPFLYEYLSTFEESAFRSLAVDRYHRLRS